MPEADLTEALGRPIGGVWGGGSWADSTPGIKLSFRNPGPALLLICALSVLMSALLVLANILLVSIEVQHETQYETDPSNFTKCKSTTSMDVTLSEARKHLLGGALAGKHKPFVQFWSKSSRWENRWHFSILVHFRQIPRIAGKWLPQPVGVFCMLPSPPQRHIRQK